jgi:hypothetical protein
MDAALRISCIEPQKIHIQTRVTAFTVGRWFGPCEFAATELTERQTAR